MPTVTQVLRALDKSYLNVPAEILDAASARGQEVHRLCIGYAKGLWVGEVLPEFMGYFTSFTRWFDEYVEKVWLAEERLYDSVLDYNGEPDLIVTIRSDSLPSLWDLKTPIQPLKSWRPQVAAYHRLAVVNGYEVGRCGCIRLSPEGRPPLLDESTDTVVPDLSIFISALNCWRYFQTEEKNGDSRRNPVSPGSVGPDPKGFWKAPKGLCKAPPGKNESLARERSSTSGRR